jgi:uncharacterized protein YaaR (DUF327 family)
VKIDRDKSVRQNLYLNRKTVEDKLPPTRGAFQKALSQANDVDVTARLDQLMELIEEKAKKLRQHMTIQNLSEYRHFVKQFLKTFNEEFMHSNQSFSWNRGSMKNYTVLAEIDENLEQLRSLFMDEQKDSLKIIEKLDAIRGLLLDFYM